MDGVRGRWWGRGRGMPASTYEAWRSSLEQVPGRPARILAWARTPTGVCVGSPAVLSVGEGPVGEGPVEDAPSFRHLPWHEIERGGWNAETRRLSWVLYPEEDGRSRRGFVELVEPGRLPELFRERVAASIVYERFSPLVSAADGGVTISARRDLPTGAELHWHATPSRGTDWRREDVRAEAEQVLGRVRAEYDITPTGW